MNNTQLYDEHDAFHRLMIRSYLQDKPDFYKYHPQSFKQSSGFKDIYIFRGWVWLSIYISDRRQINFVFFPQKILWHTTAGEVLFDGTQYLQLKEEITLFIDVLRVWENTGLLQPQIWLFLKY